ncbi:winged helix-turn-helix domain-containing protein [Phytohabitans kaempferiae]|uniref:Winged helix-turn-helix domain-containing protein n=1 Tax=Phytohabitans kaempferiae TaxID=1620943 RepID=A0ABV6M444_9ACTN
MPALTVTFTVPLAGESMSPHAFRLLEVVRDLVERGEGTVTIAPSGVPPAPLAAPAPLALPAGEPAETAAAAVPGALRISRASRTVTRGGAPLDLTRLEFDLLVFLAENPRRVFTRLQLLGSVWGYEHAVARTVDVHVRRLRAKVGDHVPLVTTVYGVGYRLADDARVELLPDD